MNVELVIVRALFIKGFESMRVINGTVEKCVVYIDINASTLFCGNRKRSSTVDGYSFSNFAQVIPEGDTVLTVVFNGLTPLVLQFSNPKTRDYMATMIPKLMV